MLSSQYLMPNSKNWSAGNQVDTFYLMQRAGLIQKLTADNYICLPLGARILQKIKAIVHEEIEKEGGLEIILPGQHHIDRQKAVIELMRHQIRSFKQLPRIFYQDLEIYFFHLDPGSLHEIYQTLMNLWQRIFLKLEISSASHVYQHEEINVTVLLADGKATKLQLGYYGLDWLHLISTIAAQHQDEFGIIWPEKIAPFQIGIIPLQMQKSYRVRAAAEQLYQQLQATGFTVFLDDRKERPGLLFAEMDLLGIPHRLLITERGLDSGTVEYKSRRTSQIQHLELNSIPPLPPERG